MRLRKAAGERRSSDRRSNNFSWISEVTGISNVAVKKKRGRRAPPSAKRSRGKKVDKLIDSDDALGDDINDTDEDRIGTSQSIEHIEESVDRRTDDPDTSKMGVSGDSSDDPSSAPQDQDLLANSKDISQRANPQIAEKVSGKRMRSKRGKCQNDLEKEDGSCMDSGAMKTETSEERSPRKTKDYEVSDAQLNMTSFVDKNSEEVEDVKVCDICGDVGDEDRLAVCSRCHDGAEHTYCMRVMMEDVPDSEWLCEDCQTAVEFEKKKLEICEVKVGTSKQQSFDKKMSRPPEAAKSISSDSKSEAENVGNKELDIANEGNDTADSRMEEDAVITSSVKETVLEPGNLGIDTRKRLPMSRESSFKFDVDKGKQPGQVVTSLAPSAPKNQTPQARGLLSKSVSFNNSKVPKVKQLLHEVPQKPKCLKESWSSIIKKEGPVSMTTKSATFKKPKPCEPANKAKSSGLSTVEGPRVSIPCVSQKVTNDRCSSILGCPSTATVVPPSRAEITAQHLASGNTMADTSSLSAAHGQKNFLGNNDMKKPLLAVGSTGILGAGAQKKITQNSDPSHRDNKIKDPSGFRQGASINRTIRCERCNEAGHSTQFCTVDKLRLSAIKPLSERNSEEAASNKRNITSETGTSVATETTTCRSADQSEQILSAGDEQIASTIPELDYIWQGGFELRRTGRSPELCDGFQAHLSCSASQLVLEVAKKFPSKVQLEELPRQNSWPTQFQKTGPTYNNVGLYFFARDAQSYENHYSKLVENMLKNDLVLRGSVGTVELLIFPSNILSKNFPRWNMFYFLWGVFRARRKDYSSFPPDVPKCAGKSNLNEDPCALGLNASVHSSSHSFSNDINSFAKPETNFVKNTTYADNEHLPTLEAYHQECLKGENYFNQPVVGVALDKYHDSVTASSTNNNAVIENSAAVTEKNHEKLNYSEHQDKLRGSTGNVSERDFDVNMVPDDCSMPLIHDEGPGKGSKSINLNDAEQLMDMDRANTANTGALGSFSDASGSAHKRHFEMVNGADEVDGTLEHKKIKLDNVVSASSGFCEMNNDVRPSSKVHPISAPSVDDRSCNKPMASTDGKCVFPLDLNAVDDAVSGDIVNIPSSDED